MNANTALRVANASRRDTHRQALCPPCHQGSPRTGLSVDNELIPALRESTLREGNIRVATDFNESLRQP